VTEKGGWLSRLKQGLSRSAGGLGENITGLFTKRKLDQAALDELEDLLIAADLGPVVAAEVTGRLAATRFGKEVSEREIKGALAEVVRGILEPVAAPLHIDAENQPHVVLVVGVNGTGKTTTIGKVARQLAQHDQKVTVAACDTFRAAAIEQLKVWADRAGARFVSRGEGADPAAVAYEAVEQARRDGSDVLLIDTAGRLQNKQHLMAELEKVIRVVRKLDATAPHGTLLVLDATTGQNALNQVEVFRQVCNVTGLAMTKLDGTARGGVLVAVAQRFGLPVHFIGVGEGADDLRPFDAEEFAKALTGLA
jgi:fused signal recognition particle receptor